MFWEKSLDSTCSRSYGPWVVSRGNLLRIGLEASDALGGQGTPWWWWRHTAFTAGVELCGGGRRILNWTAGLRGQEAEQPRPRVVKAFLRCHQRPMRQICPLACLLFSDGRAGLAFAYYVCLTSNVSWERKSSWMLRNSSFARRDSWFKDPAAVVLAMGGHGTPKAFDLTALSPEG